MKTMNITKLRTHLSQVLDRVKNGEEVEIIDRNVPVARLVPVKPTTPARKKIPPWLAKLERAGIVTIGTLGPSPLIVKGFPPGTPVLGDRAVEAIIQERRTGR